VETLSLEKLKQGDVKEEYLVTIRNNFEVKTKKNYVGGQCETHVRGE
jgi:hypothetical protein